MIQNEYELMKIYNQEGLEEINRWYNIFKNSNYTEIEAIEATANKIYERQKPQVKKLYEDICLMYLKIIAPQSKNKKERHNAKKCLKLIEEGKIKLNIQFEEDCKNNGIIINGNIINSVISNIINNE